MSIWTTCEINKIEEFGIILSSGQQQWFCIAGTIALELEIILMDEAASVFDPVSTTKVGEQMLR